MRQRAGNEFRHPPCLSAQGCGSGPPGRRRGSALKQTLRFFPLCARALFGAAEAAPLGRCPHLKARQGGPGSACEDRAPERQTWRKSERELERGGRHLRGVVTQVGKEEEKALINSHCLETSFFRGIDDETGYFAINADLYEP